VCRCIEGSANEHEPNWAQPGKAQQANGVQLVSRQTQGRLRQSGKASMELSYANIDHVYI
jgi:hypothetical protein